ncbi:MAG: NfeD family protein [Gammaproteobacteria bacterium]
MITLNFWTWFTLAGCLAIMEVFTGTFVLLFLGIAAALNGVIFYFNPMATWQVQLLSYAILGGTSLLLWFFYLKEKFLNKHGNAAGEKINNKMAQYLGRVFVLTQALENGYGQIKIGDAYWKVLSDQDAPVNTKVKLIKIEGMSFKVDILTNV